jgi:hypothetical protein
MPRLLYRRIGSMLQKVRRSNRLNGSDHHPAN